jgi:RNA polymerase sigma factor (sigma-70 family)
LVFRIPSPKNSQNNLFGFRVSHTYTNGMNSDDMALVQEYAQSNSEQAFATLVSQHVNLVYSVALRQVRDPHLAEEITQSVFIILVGKAKSLSPKTILSGWLCRTARYVSATTLSIQRRRQFREQEAHMESILNEPEPGVWNQIAPLLDEALNCLGEKEHDAVVLRVFDGKELKQVGAAMGTTEDAARMRVNRGVETLREFFTKRGVTLSATAIAGAVAANSVQAAPAGLAATIAAAALSGTTITTTAAIAATKAIAMTTLQRTIVTVTVAVLAGAGIYEARQAAQLHNQVRTLQQHQTPLAEQIQRLSGPHR